MKLNRLQLIELMEAFSRFEYEAGRYGLFKEEIEKIKKEMERDIE